MIFVDGKTVKSNYKVVTGQSIDICLPEPKRL